MSDSPKTYDVAPDWVKDSEKFFFHEETRTIQVKSEFQEIVALKLKLEAYKIAMEMIQKTLSRAEAYNPSEP